MLVTPIYSSFSSQYSLSYLQSALGWDHIEKVEKHDSQKDYKTGFGGKFGVQQGSMDKSALGWEHVEKVEKHESQKGEISLSILCSDQKNSTNSKNVQPYFSKQDPP